VEANAAQSAIQAVSSAGLELPATSLIGPFLADLRIFSPCALLETLFSNRNTHGTSAFDDEVISMRDHRLEPRRRRFSCAKYVQGLFCRLTVAVNHSALALPGGAGRCRWR